MTTHRHPLLSLETVREFMFAGHATLTLVSKRSGVRFTYKVSQAADRETQRPVAGLFFVSVMTGSDNEHNFSYLGTIRNGAYAHGRKSKIAATAASAVGFSWFLAHIEQDVLPEQIEVWHEGRCGRCNRKLTVPSSIENGLGPECFAQMHPANIAA